MTLTNWWQALLDRYAALQKQFPAIDINHHAVVVATSNMATNGLKLETASTFELQGLNNTILSYEKTLNAVNVGREVQGIGGFFGYEKNYLPVVHLPIDALVAVAYYQHFATYQDITAEKKLINDGLPGFPGLQSRKPTVAKHAQTLKADIMNFLESDENITELSQIDAKFKQLLELNKNARFDVFVELSLAPVIVATDDVVEEVESPLTQTFEEKLGERLVQQFSIMPDSLEHRLLLIEQTNFTAKVLEDIRICKRVLNWVNNSLHQPSDFEFNQFKQMPNVNIKVIDDYHEYLLNKQHLEQERDIERRAKASTPIVADSPWKVWGEWLASCVGIAVENKASLTSSADVEEIEPNAVTTMRDMTGRIMAQQVAQLNVDGISFESVDVEQHSDQDIRHLIMKNQLIADILTIDARMLEFTQTHSTWFSRQVLSLLKSFYTNDTELLKVYFMPSKWKLIYEAERLQTVMSELRTEIESAEVAVTDVQTTFNNSLQRTTENMQFIPSFNFFNNVDVTKDFEAKIITPSSLG